MRPLREIAGRTVAQAKAVLAPDGLDGPLAVVEKMLLDDGEPARQRRLVAADGMAALLADLVARTANANG
jgi:carboxylate-amine ligase